MSDPELEQVCILPASPERGAYERVDLDEELVDLAGEVGAFYGLPLRRG